MCLEATARKPGNVHPEAAFADLTYADFIRSAEVIAPILAKAPTAGVGETIYQAAAATREQVGSNSNLGMLLLLAPLAAVPLEQSLGKGIQTVLAGLTREDARWVYRAIRLSEAGGLGKRPKAMSPYDPTGTLVEMMKLAAGRDRIASEYAAGFRSRCKSACRSWRALRISPPIGNRRSSNSICS